jgi:acyl carrier protein
MQATDIEREVGDFVVSTSALRRANEPRHDGSLLGDVIGSVRVLDLVAHLQARFEISVEDEDLDSINNLADMLQESPTPRSRFWK